MPTNLRLATGKNAEKVVLEFDGLDEFDGTVMHVCDIRSGEVFDGKRVLVVGCGNSGLEVSLDLCHHNALPSMVVRSSMKQMEVSVEELWRRNMSEEVKKKEMEGWLKKKEEGGIRRNSFKPGIS
ncbi:hypothetical protein L6452_10140 [Arctium lappa]|uniref:Uncharacterized protein n=1 Tax=Arctium lappa TaxID=4217 RepID=A0ACB9DMQ6_ARCLA|nr:hypothetical protein L6452_10140 [Arctium lappa]